MNEYIIQGETLTAIADAIREKTETTDIITTANMAGLIAGIEGMRVVSGSFTLSENKNNLNAYKEGGIGTWDDCTVKITHNLGKLPKYGMLINISSDLDTRNTNMRYGMFYQNGEDYEQICLGSYYSSASVIMLQRATAPITRTESQINTYAHHPSWYTPWWEATSETIRVANVPIAGTELSSGQTFMWFMWG